MSNPYRNNLGQFSRAEGVSSWRDINFYADYLPYYETHTRDATINYFNISLQQHKAMCKFYNYNKPWHLIRKTVAKDKTIENDWSDIDFNLFKHYYETHTWDETLSYFKINKESHEKLLKLYNYQKSKFLVCKCTKRKYFIRGKYFNSLPEAAVYIYCVDNNISIKQEPTVFTYEVNGKKHKYFPDFEIAGQLVEIKGDHFFRLDGTMCNPYNHKEDERYEAKHLCGIQNNVKFWTSKDYVFAIDYCTKTYGNDWFKEEDLQYDKN